MLRLTSHSTGYIRGLPGRLASPGPHSPSLISLPYFIFITTRPQRNPHFYPYLQNTVSLCVALHTCRLLQARRPLKLLIRPCPLIKYLFSSHSGPPKKQGRIFLNFLNNKITIICIFTVLKQDSSVLELILIPIIISKYGVLEQILKSRRIKKLFRKNQNFGLGPLDFDFLLIKPGSAHPIMRYS